MNMESPGQMFEQLSSDQIISRPFTSHSLLGHYANIETRFLQRLFWLTKVSERWVDGQRIDWLGELRHHFQEVRYETDNYEDLSNFVAERSEWAFAEVLLFALITQNQ